MHQVEITADEISDFSLSQEEFVGEVGYQTVFNRRLIYGSK